MADKYDSAIRSKIMARVKSTGNKTTEVRFRAYLIRSGIRGWRVQAMWLPGKPDFIFPNQKLAVFIDGCFWHGCPRCCRMPTSNVEYWTKKVKYNQRRIKTVQKELNKQHWSVMRVWEHEIRDYPARVIDRIRRRLSAQTLKLCIHKNFS